jgi:hypothetical protein
VVEVIIPWAGGCPHRERALHWVLARYAAEHPDWRATVATAPDGPWSKARAAMPAIERSSADIVVVADADCWTSGLPAAVRTVQDGAPWAIPHRMVNRLTQDATSVVLAGGSWEELPLAERAYQGLEGGGFVVAHRDTLRAVPLDPRFVGWGQEDTSWAVALNTLLGPAWRGDAPLLHLWHPPQPRMTRRRGNAAGWRLYRRYLDARADPAAMLALIEEGRRALAAHQPAVHDHAA